MCSDSKEAGPTRFLTAEEQLYLAGFEVISNADHFVIRPCRRRSDAPTPPRQPETCKPVSHLADPKYCRYRGLCRRGVADWDIHGADPNLRTLCAHCGKKWP
jgi:hypothetical protein